jgi:hypothetical protein
LDYNRKQHEFNADRARLKDRERMYESDNPCWRFWNETMANVKEKLSETVHEGERKEVSSTANC